MEPQPRPAPHLTKGLRRLVSDIAGLESDGVRGLQGVVCGRSELISFGDGDVEYCSVSVSELVTEHSFESVIWLLLHGDLPIPDELADACAILNESAVVERVTAETVAGLPLRTRPLDLLPLAISLISYFDPTPSDRTAAATRSRVWRLLAQLPVLLAVGFGETLQSGRFPGSMDPGGQSFSASLLQILRGDNVAPSPQDEAAMNSLLTCQCLTEMRPACFAARLVGSTVGDIVSALRAAASLFVAQLKNDPYQWTIEKLSSFSCPNDAEAWWNQRKSRVMPFGFAPANDDPRPAILRAHCRECLGSESQIKLEAAASRLERLLEQQDQYPTIDWVSARLLAQLGVPGDRLALAIGVARLVGWSAQAIEQHASGISLLPALRYGQE
jgi:citrate synthase